MLHKHLDEEREFLPGVLESTLAMNAMNRTTEIVRIRRDSIAARPHIGIPGIAHRSPRFGRSFT
jgi:hypothetical protein